MFGTVKNHLHNHLYSPPKSSAQPGLRPQLSIRTDRSHCLVSRSSTRSRLRAEPEDRERVIERQRADSSLSSSQANLPQPPGLVLAAGAIAAGAAVFVFSRFSSGAPTLATLERASVPFDQALASGKPTLIEFYADWCQICRESAPEVFQAEQAVKDKVNFVLMNIDNPKWGPEASVYRVRGIPHFVFLDGRGRQLGAAVGKFPQTVLSDNIDALAKGIPLPFTKARGTVSTLDPPTGKASQQTTPVHTPAELAPQALSENE